MTKEDSLGIYPRRGNSQLSGYAVPVWQFRLGLSPQVER